MASYLFIGLDTTGPQIEIVAPSYSVPGTNVPITVEADEQLSLNHEVYVIDSLGVRRDYIFAVNGNRLLGNLTFSGYPIGIATMYAKTTDLVLNESNLASKSINIVKGALLTMVSTIKVRMLKHGIITRRLEDCSNASIHKRNDSSL